MNEQEKREKLMDEIIEKAEEKYLLLSNDISDEELNSSSEISFDRRIRI